MLLVVSPLTRVGVPIWIGHNTFSWLLVIRELALVFSSIDEGVNTPTMLLLVVELAIVDFAIWIRELTAAVSWTHIVFALVVGPIRKGICTEAMILFFLKVALINCTWGKEDPARPMKNVVLKVAFKIGTISSDEMTTAFFLSRIVKFTLVLNRVTSHRITQCLRWMILESIRDSQVIKLKGL